MDGKGSQEGVAPPAPAAIPAPGIPAGLRDFFKGRDVLLTGGTGFVGKVMVEKMLRDIPQIGRIFLLTRPKKGREPQARMRSDMLASPCFDVLREKLGGGQQLEALFAEKIVAVEGDIEADRLGLDSRVEEEITTRVSVIIHMAAVLSFTERLDISCRQNVLGTMRVASLARRCQSRQGADFVSFVHMSTCYVNYNLHSDGGTPIRERLYPLKFDPLQMVKRIFDIDLQDIDVETKHILDEYGYPNTYCLTKSLAEHLLMMSRGHLPLSIIRPAIVGAAYEEPIPGWTDTLSAAGGLVLLSGVGVLREVRANPNGVADIVPVDIVVNATLRVAHRSAVRYQSHLVEMGTARLAERNSDIGFDRSEVATNGGMFSEGTPWVPARCPVKALVYHCGTSGSQNAVTWQMFRIYTLAYWGRHPHPKSILKPGEPVAVKYCTTPAEYEARHFILRKLPYLAYSTLAKTPIASESMKKNSAKWRKLVEQSDSRAKMFDPFTVKQWIFDTTERDSLNAYTDPEERQMFDFDCNRISWRTYVSNYCWGIVKFVNKESPDHDPISGEDGQGMLRRSML